MIEFRHRSSRSWFDASYSRILAAQLAEAMIERLGNRPAMFLTLTYRRPWDAGFDGSYSDPKSLFDAASDERHVRRFIDRLEAFLGRSLSGLWLRKMEFQRGGWVHWHLIIREVGWLENRNHELTHLWEHGYAWVERATSEALKYVCKYVAKDGGLPVWLYLRPQRSVRIVATSPGFWGDESRPRTDSETEHGTGCIGVYKTIGQVIEDSEDVALVRENERYSQVKIGIFELIGRLRSYGYGVMGGASGWLSATCTFDQLWRLLASERGRGERSEPGLHLTNTGEPPFRPKWLCRVIEHELQDRPEWSYA